MAKWPAAEKLDSAINDAWLNRRVFASDFPVREDTIAANSQQLIESRDRMGHAQGSRVSKNLAILC
jgi:hypothetical protein